MIPFFCFRDCDGTQRLVLERPLTVAPANGNDAPVVEAATTYARLLEGYMRRTPGQWLYWLRQSRADG